MTDSARHLLVVAVLAVATVSGADAVQTAEVTLKHPCEVLVDREATTDAVRAGDYVKVVPLCREAVVSYPGKPLYAELLRIAEEQWIAQQALTSDDANDSRAYLRLYRDGRYRSDVERHLAVIETGTAKADDDAQTQTAIVGDGSAADDASPALGRPVPVLDEREMVLEMQSELARIGCDPGPKDGIWGQMTRSALRSFARHAEIELAALEPSRDLLETLREQEGRVCPLVCSARQELKGGRCVAKTCPSGQRMNSRGVCYTPQRQASETRPARREPASAPAAVVEEPQQQPRRRARTPSGYNFCNLPNPDMC